MQRKDKLLPQGRVNTRLWIFKRMGNAALHLPATLIRTRFRPAGGTHNLFNDTPGHVNEPNFLIQELGRKVRSGQSPGTPTSQAGQEQKEINPAPGALLLASPPPPAPEEPLGAQNHEIREPWGGPASPDSPMGGFCRSFSTQKDK